ncbi:serine/threonine-protein kinase [Polaromonas sp. SM01]|uniref:serine/threonine protein kinase n=1 Tax=Polaromonas sp. SM01 TaxID=3085630 RepID=UPI002981B679|nr:serine/threonine-protein kinase [Polaromonas sp. SM01]MDW5445077.1 serine/threonine-protein kinase [Polaromonas sp. SM01]
MTDLSSTTPVSLISYAQALPPGTRLAEFELLGLLGVGGFGMVYQAFDHSLQRPVAIKEYMPAALACRGADSAVRVREPVDQLAFQAGLQSFVAEARLLAQFDHPSLVKVFRYWEGHQTAYMVMPLYRGMTLQAARDQMRSPPSEAWLRKVLWAVLGALKTLHHGQAVHRDVSPDNIFLQDIGPPVLLDLGAARHAIGGKSQDLGDALKLSYAPLEQHAGALGSRQGPWTDLYAVAAVVHGLLCSKPPLPATLRVVRDRLPPFARVARTVQEQFGLSYSPAFVLAIGQALAIEAKDRPQSVAALVQAMALETPNGMSRFDWRAELGALWGPPGAPVPTGAGRTVPAVLEESRPRPQRRPSDQATQALAVPVRRRDAAVKKAIHQSRWPWRVGAGAAGLVLLALSAALFMPRGSGAPDAGLVASVGAISPAAESERKADLTTAARDGAQAVLATTVPVSTAPDHPPVPSGPALAPKRPSGKTHAAPVDAGSPPPVPAPVSVAATVSERAEAVAPSRAAAPDPRVYCADSNFVSRPMCIYRQCQKPEMAGLALCVENKARLQNSKRFEGF